ncbi:hypothetical protein DXG01_010224 [Tephrocybe rancida]|nr:hypothetical protein DXG01_010224 [Tephrocybe rancida]
MLQAPSLTAGRGPGRPITADEPLEFQQIPDVLHGKKFAYIDPNMIDPGSDSTGVYDGPLMFEIVFDKLSEDAIQVEEDGMMRMVVENHYVPD